MPTNKSSRTHLAAIPSRHWAYRSTLLLLVAASVVLLSMSRAGNPTATRVRTTILDIVTPILAVAASPFNAIHDAGNWFSDMSRLRAENLELRNQNIQLLKWQASARDMEAQNKSLRALMNVVPAKGHSFVSARIVADFGGPYARAALLDGGSENGLKKDQAVIGENGLVGRIVDVGTSSARVLLLSDINSRVPVMAETTREKGILAGNHGEMPVLSYLSAGSSVAVGDRIVTSGDGGIFPAGIPVGVISTIEKGVVTVQLFTDISRLEYVNISN